MAVFGSQIVGVVLLSTTSTLQGSEDPYLSAQEAVSPQEENNVAFRLMTTFAVAVAVAVADLGHRAVHEVVVAKAFEGKHR